MEKNPLQLRVGGYNYGFW